MSDYGFSEIDCKIIHLQIKRRAKYREEFLRLRTDPCKNSQEAGHVFDKALHQFVAMKDTQYDQFHPTRKNIMFSLFAVVLPMVSYGYLIWNQRNKFNQDCLCGRIRYRDRTHKLI